MLAEREFLTAATDRGLSSGEGFVSRKNVLGPDKRETKFPAAAGIGARSVRVPVSHANYHFQTVTKVANKIPIWLS
jgi:hypothetical protein